MSKSLKVLILAISALNSCINVDNFNTNENNEFVKSVDNANDTVLEYMSSYKCRKKLLWHRLDLRLWKRRRRMSSYLSEQLNAKTAFNLVEELTSQSQVKDTISTARSEQLQILKKFKELWPVGLWLKYGLFTENYLSSINPHWLQFAPPDPRVQYVLASVYLIILIIGCFGNILVLCMYLRYALK